MRECPKCGNSYPEDFQYCPSDGTSLGDPADSDSDRRGEISPPPPEPVQISVRTLMLGFAVLVMCALIAFAGVFFYQYWKPKYGNLIVKTTPSGAMIYVDGKLQGASPITLSDLRSGGHQLKGTKEGYMDFVHQVTVMPYSTENLHYDLEPIIPQLSNEERAEVEALGKKMESAQEENILFPPPDDYNVLYFANKILSIDPANSNALKVKEELAEKIRRLAEFAYAREDWAESEKLHKNLALLLPDDPSIQERLAEIQEKREESAREREKQIEEWKLKVEAAIKRGSLVPPDKDNALDAIRGIQHLEKDNRYALEALSRLKELLQNRGDTKMATSDWRGAQRDFQLVLQYFPTDKYSKERLTEVEAELEKIRRIEQQNMKRVAEEQESQKKIDELRLEALESFRTGNYQKSISEWQKYLEQKPDSDEAYFYIGASYQDQKQLDRAIHNFEKCLSINPNNTLAHLNLGILYDYHRNNFEQAEEHLRRAMDLGGVEQYDSKRLQSMIDDLQHRMHVNSILKMLFPVEHKHTFSSCRGNLRFTEEGMEYRTTETDHSFYVEFTGLKAFEINDDNLFIKTRNNKNYNFRFLNYGDAARVSDWYQALRRTP